MRQHIYAAIKNALQNIQDENNKPVIKHISVWNNQLQHAIEEQPFYTPAVFIEFAPIQWQHLSHGAREAAIQTTLHVVTDSRVGKWEDAIAIFDLLDTINRSLHGLHVSTENGSHIDALTLISSNTDHDFDELQDNTETFECHVTDASAFKGAVVSGLKIARPS